MYMFSSPYANSKFKVIFRLAQDQGIFTSWAHFKNKLVNDVTGSPLQKKSTRIWTSLSLGIHHAVSFCSRNCFICKEDFFKQFQLFCDDLHCWVYKKIHMRRCFNHVWQSNLVHVHLPAIFNVFESFVVFRNCEFWHCWKLE